MLNGFVTTNPICISPHVLPPPTTTTPIIVPNTTRATTSTTTKAFTYTTTTAFTNTTNASVLNTTSITTTPPPAEIKNLIRLEIDVENLDVQTCLCLYKNAEKELSNLTLSRSAVISCGETQCFNFSCVCPDNIPIYPNESNASIANFSNVTNINISKITNTTRRRLLQTEEIVTAVLMVYEDNNVQITDDQVNQAMRRAYNNQTTIRTIRRQTLNMKGMSWNVEELFRNFLNALDDNTFLFIIVGAAGAGVVIIIIVFVLVFVVFRKEVFGETTTVLPQQIASTKTQRVLKLKLNLKHT
jgi:hypothetical protein